MHKAETGRFLYWTFNYGVIYIDKLATSSIWQYQCECQMDLQGRQHHREATCQNKKKLLEKNWPADCHLLEQPIWLKMAINKIVNRLFMLENECRGTSLPALNEHMDVRAFRTDERLMYRE